MSKGPEFGSQGGPEGRRRHPAWAERERQSDLKWINENIHVFWPAAQSQYQEQGRGVIMVDTTSRPTGEGHPFAYFPEEAVKEHGGDEDIERMIREYDPTREFVVVLLKSQDRMSTYRVHPILRGKRGHRPRKR